MNTYYKLILHIKFLIAINLMQMHLNFELTYDFQLFGKAQVEKEFFLFEFWTKLVHLKCIYKANSKLHILEKATIIRNIRQKL